MYAPVATRFATYGVELDGPAGDYVRTLLEMPAMIEWYAGAALEPWQMADNDNA